MMKGSTLTIFLVLCGVAAFADVGAEAVPDDLEAASKLYQSGDLEGSANALEAAAARIRAQDDATQMGFFPAPLDGWRAGAPRSQTDLATKAIAGKSYTRLYRRDDGAEVMLGLVIDSPIFPFLSMAVLDPVKSGKHKGLTPYNLGKWSGTLDRIGDESYMITLVAGQRLIVQGRSFGIPDHRVLAQYIEALDISAILNALDQE
jgi:hypothetical protein